MNDRPLFYSAPFVNSVFHPSDFSPASENAFAHALAIALNRQTKLTIMHAGGRKDAWTSFPGVRETLERWGLLEPGSPKSAVFDELKVRVKKVNKSGGSTLSSILNYLAKRPTDLLVIATEGREGLPRWIRPSLAEKLAQKARTMTLFVPARVRGFVSLQTGNLSLNRLLLPIDFSPSPLPAVEYAARIARDRTDPIEITLLHVGESNRMPDVELPGIPLCTWKKELRTGEVVEQVAQTALRSESDLILMTTAGQQGILDALRGTVTEQVLRRAPCPLLAVPVGWKG
jgi:nucleotide-binding universal stress UspA family protein